MTEPFLSIRGIRKVYGSVTAVKNVTMDISEGEFMTFLGPSGSGKSTTLYILAGFQDPSDGDILLKGKSILSTPSVIAEAKTERGRDIVPQTSVISHRA